MKTMRMNEKEIRIIRIALSHYAYAEKHTPKQRGYDLISAAVLIWKIEKKVENTKKSIDDYVGAIKKELLR